MFLWSDCKIRRVAPLPRGYGWSTLSKCSLCSLGPQPADTLLTHFEHAGTQVHLLVHGTSTDPRADPTP